jgi:hypothetical protein
VVFFRSTEGEGEGEEMRARGEKGERIEKS